MTLLIGMLSHITAPTQSGGANPAYQPKRGGEETKATQRTGGNPGLFA